MEKERLTAFSDGVIAVIITIMALELKTPHEASLGSLKEAIPVFFSYVLSFICGARFRHQRQDFAAVLHGWNSAGARRYADFRCNLLP